MAVTYHYEKAQLGDWRSPLDYLDTVITNDANWVVKNRAYSPAPITGQNRLEELWIQSTNTTSGQTLSIQFKSTYGGDIEVAYSRDTDLAQTWDNQPEAPKNSVSREGTKGNYQFITMWGRTMAPNYTVIALSRDLIHVVWQGSHNDSEGAHRLIVYFGALDKTHNYEDGVAFITSHKSGKSYFGIHYNTHWYQEGFGTATSLEGLQGRLNDLSNSRMFEMNYNVHGLYANPIALHCNTGLGGADTNLELVGFLPSGSFGTYYSNFPNILVQEEIHNKTYFAMPITNVPYINTILYPLS